MYLKLGLSEPFDTFKAQVLQQSHRRYPRRLPSTLCHSGLLNISSVLREKKFQFLTGGTISV
ncbi:hypothetical protein BDR06DRAFT_956247 [Suillus hirtellus]|nr:hypothetical protein BDR06DRAFT_956247 [Suillus hirtellus]